MVISSPADTSNVIAFLGIVISFLVLAATIVLFVIGRRSQRADARKRTKERDEDALVRAREFDDERRAREQTNAIHTQIADSVRTLVERETPSPDDVTPETEDRSFLVTRPTSARDLLFAIDPASAERLRWRLERGGGAHYVLRNLGPGGVHGVHVDVPGLPDGLVRHRPVGDVNLADGEGHTITMTGAWGVPLPNQVWVTTHEHPDRIAILMPEP